MHTNYARFGLLLLFGLLAVDSADITLLVKKVKARYSYKCIATGRETLDHAMTWIFPNVNDFKDVKNGSNYIGLQSIDNFSQNIYLSDDMKNFTSRSLYHNLPIVLDYRWERFKIQSDERIKLNKVYIIHLSIFMIKNETTATIKLNLPSGSVQTIVGTQTTNTTFTNHSVGDPNINPGTETTVESSGKWHHYSIYFMNDTYNLEQNGNIYRKNIETFTVDSLEVIGNYGQEVVWKIYDYKFLKIPNSDHKTRLFLEDIRIYNKTVCISFHLFMEESCGVNVQLCERDNDTNCINKNYTRSGEWTEYRIAGFKLETYLNRVTLRLQKINKCFAAIDDIRHCDTDETRILSLETDQNDVRCVSLAKQTTSIQYRKPKSFKNSSWTLENIGLANNVSCEILQEGKYCNKNVICNEDQCYCSAGYKGNYCNTGCSSGSWGINCEETCQCSNDCDMHVGCSACLTGTLGSTCANPYINSNIEESDATSVSFSLIGKEKYIGTKTFCITKPPSENNKEREYNFNDSHLHMYGLMPNFQYKISCRFCYHSNCTPFKDIGNFTTNNCTDLTIGNINESSKESSITLTVVELTYNHCPLSQYKVYLSHNVTRVLESITIISSLQQNTNYTVKITREESKLIELHILTDYSKPGAVHEIKQINKTCFRVTPSEQNFKITGYEFSFKACSNYCPKSDLSKWINITKTVNSSTICHDLIPDSYYSVEVRAFNDKGLSEISRSLEVTTDPQDEITDEETLVDFVNGTAKFKLPNCAQMRGPLFYHIRSECLEVWCKKQIKKDVLEYGKDAFEEFIKSLPPYSRHNFNIHLTRSNNSIGNGRKVKRSLTTPPARPNQVESLAKYTCDNDSVSIRWKPPYPPTGEIEAYQVEYCRNGNCERSDHKQCLLWDEYQCSDLKGMIQGVTYNITVSSKNKLVNDMNITSITAKTEQKPSESPKYFKAVNTTSCDILLTWSYPELPNGRIRYFDVTLIDVYSDQSTNISINAEPVKRLYEHRITNLTAMKYKMYIQANNIYNGERSNTVTVTICSRYSHRSIAFQWFISLCIMTMIATVVCLIILVYFKFRKSKIRDRPSEEMSLIPHSTRLLKKIDFKTLLSNFRNEAGENIFEKEFEDFDDPILLSQEVGAKPENRLKNRFRNVIPYDDTRVILGDLAEFDYINASYVTGHKGNTTYIATQCPKKETVYDFWSMIWQEQVKIIVCLATITEGAVKMFQYWPDDYIHVQYEDITICHKFNSRKTDFIVRHLVATRDNETREILQCYYISWPDQSIPLFPLSLLDYVKHIQSLQITNTSPTVVHCSAGIGRTGTFIMCDHLIGIDGDEVDVLEYLKNIRRCRPKMVSRVSQYKLIYFILDEYFSGQNTAIEKLKMLDMQQEEVDRILAKQFKYTFERQYAHNMLHFVATNDVISEMPSTFADGYEGERKFISLRLQPKNLNNIWWTIDQNNVKTVLVLQETHGINMFWPSDLPEKRVESFTINLDKVTDCGDTVIYDLNYNKRGEADVVRVIHYKNWKSNATKPNNPESFYELYMHYKQLNGKENETIMLCCQDGTTACGLFITLDLVIKKLEIDGIFDISWAVLGIRPHHQRFMNELAQFKFIYEVVKQHLNPRVASEYQNTQQTMVHYENV